MQVNAENVVVNVIERVRRDIPDECRQPPPPDHVCFTYLYKHINTYIYRVGSE